MTRVLLTVIALAFLAAIPPSAQADHFCGTGTGEGVIARDISSSFVSCKRARQVADKAAKVTSFGGCVSVAGSIVQFGPCTVVGYRCKSMKRLSSFQVRARCTKGRVRIRFELS